MEKKRDASDSEKSRECDQRQSYQFLVEEMWKSYLCEENLNSFYGPSLQNMWENDGFTNLDCVVPDPFLGNLNTLPFTDDLDYADQLLDLLELPDEITAQSRTPPTSHDLVVPGSVSSVSCIQDNSSNYKCQTGGHGLNEVSTSTSDHFAPLNLLNPCGEKTKLSSDKDLKSCKKKRKRCKEEQNSGQKRKRK